MTEQITAYTTIGRHEVMVEAEVTLRTADYYDPVLGGWLPGDADEVSILAVTFDPSGEGVPESLWEPEQWALENVVLEELG